MKKILLILTAIVFAIAIGKTANASVFSYSRTPSGDLSTKSFQTTIDGADVKCGSSLYFDMVIGNYVSLCHYILQQPFTDNWIVGNGTYTVYERCGTLSACATDGALETMNDTFTVTLPPTPVQQVSTPVQQVSTRIDTLTNTAMDYIDLAINKFWPIVLGLGLLVAVIGIIVYVYLQFKNPAL